MINRIDKNEISNIASQAKQQTQKQPSDTVNEPDTRIDVKYQQLLDKAAQPQQADRAKIEEAKRLLLSDQLDTTENIRKAAQNIAKYGI